MGQTVDMAERTAPPNRSNSASEDQASPETARWRRFGVTDRDASRAVRELWSTLGNPRTVASSVEVSANVSTNRVFLLRLNDDTRLFAKVSNYGSAFLFREDHDRVLRLRKGLAGTRFENFLAAQSPSQPRYSRIQQRKLQTGANRFTPNTTVRCGASCTKKSSDVNRCQKFSTMPTLNA